MSTKRKSKPKISGLLLFSARDQLRFVEGVERFQSLVNDLTVLVETFKRKRGLPTTESEKAKQLGEGVVS